MTWNPHFKVVDVTNTVDNLLGYIETHQAEVLLWAQGDPVLAGFAGLYANAAGRLGTLFPSLMVLSQRSETDLSGDILITGLELVLEGTVTGSSADLLVLNTKTYAMALESILANIESEDLTGDPQVTAQLFEVGTTFDILRGQKTANSWMQIFQTKCLYKLMSAAEPG
jgi:hypothetical protein